MTHPVTADVLLRGQLAFLRGAGFDVTVIASPGASLERVGAREGVGVVEVDMARDPAPRRDLGSLARLTRALRTLDPGIVIASTPKAGLLGMLAARALAVPRRIYLLRGLRLETEQGARRTILSATERIASACAHDVVCVSESLRAAAVSGGLVSPRKACVLGHGSSNGVDVARFDLTERAAEIEALRKSLRLEGRTVIGFIGRISRDKGIAALLSALAAVRREHPEVALLFVGADFAGDTDAELYALLQGAGDSVRTVPHVDDPAPYYGLMRVLAFPSLREGFPNVPLEAAAAGVATVGYRATGVVDAVIDGATGTLVERGDVEGLASALRRYVGDAALAAEQGAAARRRARADFGREQVWSAWLRLLTSR